MAYIKVKSVGVVINGQPAGSTVEMTEAEAKHYEALGYIERIAQPTPVKKESAPKKPATRARAKTTTTTTE